MESLKGKVALVTGAASGLGEATALALSAAGATVVTVDVNEQGLARVIEEVKKASPESFSIVADVANWEQVSAAVDRVVQKLKTLDILINNAGIDHTLPITEMTNAQWEQVIGVNLGGAFRFAKAAFQQMIWQKSGHIVNVSSTAGKRGWPEATAYCASKFGLYGLTQALVGEGRPYGIRVSLVAPGGMRTHFFDRFEVPPDPEKLNDPKNVADLIVFIVSQPPDSVINEVLICSMNETSWP
ncbi:MAG: SDR family oxidoreductase [Chloroflexi bacterium]|nr:SDR family oxidoreductase [Chloroflexota bacterium]